MATRLLLVDDNEMLREGLCALLGNEENMEVVGEADCGATAMMLAEELSPDVVITEIDLSDMSGMELASQIRAKTPEVKVIALSMHAEKRNVRDMLEAGANGYMVKWAGFREMSKAIRMVLSGRSYLSPDISEILVADLVRRRTGEKPGRPMPLSPREEEVIEHLADGMSTKQIAYKMDISARTVETHRRHIMEKLCINNVAGLTKYAIREGLSDLNS